MKKLGKESNSREIVKQLQRSLQDSALIGYLIASLWQLKLLPNAPYCMGRFSLELVQKNGLTLCYRQPALGKL